MRWVIFGANGMLGSEFRKTLESESSSNRFITRKEADLTGTIVSIANQVLKADILVNCVAYTKVDQAEDEPDEALKVNHLYAAKLAEVARLLDAKFIHFSTDYVFDGESKVPYPTAATPNPQSSYGRSKYLGELAVSNSGADYSIFRTSWLYGSNGSCFPKTIATKSLANAELKIVDDQIGAPTWTRDVVELTIKLATERDLPRIVHAVSSGSTSWYGFAQEIQRSMNSSPLALLTPVPSSEYKTKAPRPKFSVLDNSELGDFRIGNWLDSWRRASPEVLQGIHAI